MVQFESDLQSKKNNLFHEARLVFVATQGPLDIALIQLKNVPYQFSKSLQQSEESHPVPITWNKNQEITPGETVYVLGYPLFHPLSSITASVSQGLLSHVSSNDENVPVLLQTSALVHHGNSGGLVLNAKGDWIGMVTSNAKFATGTTTLSDHVKPQAMIIPSLNFAIPASKWNVNVVA